MKLAEQTLDSGLSLPRVRVAAREYFTVAALETHPAAVARTHTEHLSPLAADESHQQQQNFNSPGQSLGTSAMNAAQSGGFKAPFARSPRLCAPTVCVRALCFECICKVESCQPNGAALFYQSEAEITIALSKSNSLLSLLNNTPPP
jgi:hypothetical protein